MGGHTIRRTSWRAGWAGLCPVALSTVARAPDCLLFAAHSPGGPLQGTAHPPSLTQSRPGASAQGEGGARASAPCPHPLLAPHAAAESPGGPQSWPLETSIAGAPGPGSPRVCVNNQRRLTNEVLPAHRSLEASSVQTCGCCFCVIISQAPVKKVRARTALWDVEHA